MNLKLVFRAVMLVKQILGLGLELEPLSFFPLLISRVCNPVDGIVFPPVSSLPPDGTIY